MATQDHTIESNPAPPHAPSAWPDTPEALIAGLPTEPKGSPYDLVLCALLRAHAVAVLLGSEFSNPERDPIGDHLIVNALWNVQGHLEIAQHLLGKLEVAHV